MPWTGMVGHGFADRQFSFGRQWLVTCGQAKRLGGLPLPTLFPFPHYAYPHLPLPLSASRLPASYCAFAASTTRRRASYATYA